MHLELVAVALEPCDDLDGDQLIRSRKTHLVCYRTI
jgi:hypothetical protein